MSNQTHPEPTSTDVGLAPATPGSPLHDVRASLLAKSAAELADRVKQTTYDALVEYLTVPGEVNVYARYRLPGVQEISALQGAILKDDRKGKIRNHMTYNIKFLYDLCEGMFVVDPNNPDEELSLDQSVPSAKATDPDTWPDFEDGWAAIVAAVGIDPKAVRNGYDLIKVIYSEGQVVATVDKLAEVAGFRGN